MQASSLTPVTVLVALQNSLDREAYAARIDAEPGWRSTSDMFDGKWDIALGERCVEPGRTVVLATSNEPPCVCCRSTQLGLKWCELFDILATNAGRRPPEPPFSLEDLTRRERQVLCLVGQGKSVNECADELGVAVSTIGNHKYRLMRKLRVATSLQLMRLAIQHRLI